MTQEERVIVEARNLLASERDREIAAQKLCGYGVNYEQARGIITSIYKENKATNRKGSFWKFILGGAGLVLSIVILVVGHRVFPFLLIASGAACVWGLAGTLAASGYEIDGE